MENVTWLLENKLRCELEVMGDPDRLVPNYTGLLLLRYFCFLNFFSSS